jgi:hypothetical protein
MLVTFHTKAYADIVMFEDVAKTLMGLMGHSGAIPSAIDASNVADSLERLRSAIAQRDPLVTTPNEEEGPGRVGLAQRAYPLIQLLTAAANRGCAVSWSAR